MLHLARALRRRRGGQEGEEGRVVIVGLGNPGARYERTRHNAGAMALAVLAERTGTRFRRHKSGCLVGETSVAGHRAVLARPLSFMNESGRPVREVARWYGAGAQDLVVVHDEIDIAFGQVRVKRGGGTAGHNGLKSVGAHLGTKDFARVRIGVSRPAGNRDAADWVLAAFSAAERRDLPEILERAADAVERIVEVGLDAAMNEFNGVRGVGGLGRPTPEKDGGSGGRRPRTPNP